MELEQAETIVTELLAPKYLSPAQKMVFRAAWKGESYRDLAVAAGYEFNYIKGVGAQVWKMLATATNTKVSKINFRQVLESLTSIEQSATSAVDSTQSQIDWIEDLDISAFYGRELERNKLHRWIEIDRCRVVAILGMGGMGKTTMAIELLRKLPSVAQTTVAADPDRFSCILWRSLLNAPPLKELLPELIHTLATSLGQVDRMAKSQIVADNLHLKLMPKTVTGQIDLFLKIWQQYRCLLVLDNGESIFQAGAQVGQYRAGYADYGDLFSTLGRMNHQSCLVLTSREKPIQISQLEGVNAKVRTLTLPGLDATSGQQIFFDRGCKPVAPIEWAEVNRYCGGNPLALQPIAATVQEVADGKVSEIFPYLQSSKLGFADLHVLLQQQWERLTIEEHQVMYWLAIGREPLDSVDLAAGLHKAGDRCQDNSPQYTPVARQAMSNSFLLSILQSLRRRSIISISGSDRHQQHWSLQPMVMEYVTGVFVDRICAEIEQQQPFLLNTHPIAQANAKEYIRQAQLRLIVQPAIDRLRNSIGNPAQIGKHLRRILTDWQLTNSCQLGYLTGNLLNLLTHLKLDLTDLDCSELVIQQAYLVGIDLVGVNFTNAQMVDCAFTQTFSSILAIAFSPDGQTLAASDSNGEIRLWSVSNGQCLLTCSGHTNWVRAIKFSPDGKYLASSSDDRTIKLWDLQDGGCQKTIGEGIHSLGFSFSPDGRYIASGSANNTIYYWDTQTGTCVRQFEGHQNWSMDVQVHPQGHQLASGGADGTVRLWDVASGRCDRIWNGH